MFTKEGRCEEREKGAELYLWLLTNMANNRDHRALHVLQVFYKPLLLKPHICPRRWCGTVMAPDKAFFIDYFFLLLWAVISLKVSF